ncbi:hypothetical protein G4Y79_09010 [Phototrophicus methaneseepsis]|uniref:STAS/SEC14 domain-containing protein n=1 Tax=Phototrophicus methaneseepsis TaxID=2710758 RepID=A0A7S8ECM0_9CHLR|nr:hypothetical protein [Phototrophicus methaneseepsis]QPC84497.1 hypothetical protein G4Y79_09010 [Phototrophicus methaneseepsis]
MTIHTQPGPTENILIFKLTDAFVAEEFRNMLDTELFPMVYAHPTMDFVVIYDTRETEFDFTQFNQYLKHSAARRENMPQEYDEHVLQIIVGNDNWIRSIRDWFGKRFEVRFPLFDNLEEALDFSKNHLQNIQANDRDSA